MDLSKILGGIFRKKSTKPCSEFPMAGDAQYFVGQTTLQKYADINNSPASLMSAAQSSTLARSLHIGEDNAAVTYNRPLQGYGSVGLNEIDASWGVPMSGTVMSGPAISFSSSSGDGTDPSYLAEGFARIDVDDLEILKRKWVGPNSVYSEYLNIQYVNYEDTKISLGPINGKIVRSPVEMTLKTPIEIVDSVAEGGDGVMAVIQTGSRVTIHKGYGVDQCAAAFWAAISKADPERLISNIEFMVDAIKDSVEDCGCGGECERCSSLLSSIPNDHVELDFPTMNEANLTRIGG